MIVQCAVCDSDVDETDALRLDAAEGEEPHYLCSEECLEELSENPDVYSSDLDDEDDL